ncbi:GNAT family N-acetyltransferase [Mesobacterium pallidum]|uniref:GNAT family N-acetyltransferase n=1 Tax=Mesobacterium pallidum TaxID=2872037 RepID=UPI001EE15E0F|nr:GNAT family N-acetyltransferase [Mesobacterium pallidum]
MTEVFGSAGQQQLEYRAHALFELLKDDPLYACHGRAVAVNGRRGETVQRQIRLARVQGVGPGDCVPEDEVAERVATLEAAGLAIDRYAHWRGEAEAIAAARAVLRDRSLPGDLTVTRVTPDTPVEDLRDLDQFAQDCEVLLPSGPFLRGVARPASVLFARDGAGQIVTMAASVAQFHPDSPEGRTVWWGMLATRPDRRGEGLSLWLGAQALVDMADRGYTGFQTGIRAGNTPSERLCTRLGLGPLNAQDIIAIDPASFGEGRLTK